MIQEHNSDRVVVLSERATTMTGNVLRSAVRQFFNQQNHRNPRVYRGRQSVWNLVQESGNNQLTNIEVTDQNIRSFNRTARQFGIDYALKKDSSMSLPKYLIFFKAKDSEEMTAAFKHFLNEELKRDKKPSVRKMIKSLGQ
ncbi:MAG: PcfB family protein [Oscillospiraceae bacterium]|nr:PcfB family protein [Oscillospiraceae bacterium]